MSNAILNLDAISVNFSAKDWQEAIRECGRLLLNQDLIEERYIQGMIQTVEEMGNYIVLAPGLALPHARPEQGVKKVGACIVTLQEPVDLLGKEADIFISFSAVDSDSHVEMLRGIAEVCMVEENLDAIRQAETIGEIYTVFNQE
jgi:mannitol/fructose-specific phosphotransferase system IIA component (Ntr-type)